MENPTHYPVLVFALAFILLSLASKAGALLHRRYPAITTEHKDDLGIILAATLTLLALIIGFSFSMATDRYNQRKDLEQAEANAIGTEVRRADLLSPQDAARVRELLRDYLDQRILFYNNKSKSSRIQIAERTGRLQADLWISARDATGANPTPVAALVLSGMNDVFNAQGASQAADLNRIPVAAWLLMASIAICSTLLLGYRARSSGRLAFVLPLVVSISLLLIADIDTPRHGLIHVNPENLENLARSVGGSAQ
jgi:hypothetical protein